jgi:Flp pilus assembly protein TadG
MGGSVTYRQRLGTRNKRAHKRTGDERGTSVVEFSFVALIVFFLVFGLIEVAFLVYDELGVSRMAKDAARAASAAGSNWDADYQILQAVKTSSSVPTSKVQSIIVYYVNPSNPNYIDPGCLTQAASVNSNAIPQGVQYQCNVYGPSDLNLDNTNFGCSSTSVPQLADWNLCPLLTDFTQCTPLPTDGSKGRCDVAGYDPVTARSSEAATIGVRISYQHDSLTKSFVSMGTFTITQTAKARLEPARYQNS